MYSRNGEREMEREFSHPLVPTPNNPNRQHWAGSKPGARHSTQASHVSGRNPTTEPPPLPPRGCRKLEPEPEPVSEPSALMWAPSFLTSNATKGQTRPCAGHLEFHTLGSLPFPLCPEQGLAHTKLSAIFFSNKSVSGDLSE